MIGTLPGIDANDMSKAMVTFHLISTFCTLIPVIDSSNASQFHPDMSDHERELCGQTAQFEDFVVQFLDQCFTVVESSGLETIRMESSSSDHLTNREECMKDIGMASTFNAILTQASVDIYNVALRKVKGFIQGRILEPKVAGKIAAGLCRCLCKVRPELGLKEFLPPAIRTVIDHFREEDLSKDAVLDNELTFNLVIISEVRTRRLAKIQTANQLRFNGSACAFRARTCYPSWPTWRRSWRGP
jgi:proteasome activator subunit 4